MSDITSVLLHLDGSPASAVRLQVAQRLAQRLGAQIDALYAVYSPLTLYPYSFGTEASFAGFAEDLLRLEKQQRDRAHMAFDRALSSAAAERQVRWHEAIGEPTRAFVQRAWGSDLMLLGQHDPDNKTLGGLGESFVADVLIDTGKPALVLPYTHRGPVGEQRVVLAWKRTPESARAATAALPWLKRAAQVHVLAWQEGEGDGGAALPIEPWLRSHGVAYTVHREGPVGRDLGEMLLSQLADLQADLLVMGCYGHGRTREWMLGGVTRTVLRAMTCPVLMAH